MTLEDYRDAILFIAAGGAIPPAKWVDALKARAAYNSFGALGM
jgi:hypothetical protein